MNLVASRPRPSRSQRITLLGLASLGLASAWFLAFTVRRPLLMAAPACMTGRWHGCFDTFNGVVLMTVVTLPLAAVSRNRHADRATVAP